VSKSEILQIRIDPKDRERLARIAEHEQLSQSTWARRILLRAVIEWERERGEGIPPAED
jgi:predicted HicB family RNase H-like nuclease